MEPKSYALVMRKCGLEDDPFLCSVLKTLIVNVSKVLRDRPKQHQTRKELPGEGAESPGVRTRLRGRVFHILLVDTKGLFYQIKQFVNFDGEILT